MAGEAMAARGADLAVVIDRFGCFAGGLRTTLWDTRSRSGHKVGIEGAGTAGKHG